VKLPAGKLPSALLRTLLKSYRVTDPSVVVGAAVGEDAAVIDTGGSELLVAKTDPITLASEDAGHYLLAINGNDLATMGAEPKWLLVTTLLPEGVEHEQVVLMFENLNQACAEAGVLLVGGHTEITVGLNRPIFVGCLLGTVPRNRLIRTAGAQVGDAIVLAGGIAIEGSAILASEHAAALQAGGVDAGVIKKAAAWAREPGISVLAAARAVMETGAVHSMHDPTEGGLITGLHEVAEAAVVGVRINRAAISILPECQLICDALGLDPLGLLASGALLVTLEAGAMPAALEHLRAAGIPAAHIGDVVPAAKGRTLLDGGRIAPLPEFVRDELARYLESH
jgi:hydrogenase expression/formation protein HypE